MQSRTGHLVALFVAGLLVAACSSEENGTPSTDPVVVAGPSFGAGGLILASTGVDSANASLTAIDPTTLVAVELLPSEFRVSVIASNGATFVLTAAPDGPDALFEMRDGEVAPLPAASGQVALAPAVAPDGRIVWEGRTSDSATRQLLISTREGPPTVLHETGSDIGLKTLGPDGSLGYVETDPNNGSRRFTVVDAAGAVRSVSSADIDGAYPAVPHWGPSGVIALVEQVRPDNEFPPELWRTRLLDAATLETIAVSPQGWNVLAWVGDVLYLARRVDPHTTEIATWTGTGEPVPIGTVGFEIFGGTFIRADAVASVTGDLSDAPTLPR